MYPQTVTPLFGHILQFYKFLCSYDTNILNTIFSVCAKLQKRQKLLPEYTAAYLSLWYFPYLTKSAKLVTLPEYVIRQVNLPLPTNKCLPSILTG